MPADQTPGVESWTPASWRETHDAAGWKQWQGRHNNNPPTFDPAGDDDDSDAGDGPWKD